MKKSFVAALAAAAMAVLAAMNFASCKKEKEKTLLDSIKSHGELTIATEGVWAPWSFHNDKGELTGFDIEVAKCVCKHIGVKPRFIEVEWDTIFDVLENKKCDIIVNGVGVTEERATRFYFTQPYSFSKTALIVRLDNDEIFSFKDLNGKTSANALESTYCEMAQSYGAVIIAIDTFEETLNLVMENRVDTTLNSDLSFYDYMNKNPTAPLRIAALSPTAIPVAIVCRKGLDNISLLSALDEALLKMNLDGTLTEISIKYFGKDITK